MAPFVKSLTRGVVFHGKGTVYEAEKHSYHPMTEVYCQDNAYVDGAVLEQDFERRLKPYFEEHYGDLKRLHFFDNLSCQKSKAFVKMMASVGGYAVSCPR